MFHRSATFDGLVARGITFLNVINAILNFNECHVNLNVCTVGGLVIAKSSLKAQLMSCVLTSAESPATASTIFGHAEGVLGSQWCLLSVVESCVHGAVWESW